MNDRHVVISAFLDDEPFDARELGEALTDPEGRALLIDLVALRHIVQPDEPIARPQRERPSARWSLLAAAAMLVALAGGYFIGERRRTVDMTDPPAATRVVQATEWRTVLPGDKQ